MKTHFMVVLSLATLLSLTSRSRADDHGDSFASATTIPAENPANHDFAGNLEVATDVDMFKFSITSTTMAWLYTTGTIDTKISLFDSTGTRIDINDNDGVGYNARLFRTGAERLTPGDYYLSVSAGASSSQPHTGTYTLGIRTRLNAGVFNKPNQNGTLAVAGEVDWLRFNVAQETMVWLYTTGIIDTALELFDSNGARLEYDQDDGAGYNASMFRNGSKKLIAGDYYVAVSGGENSTQPQTGAYTLSIRTQANAVTLTTPNLNASLGVLGEVDLYRIRPTRQTMAWIYTTGATDTRIYLYNWLGTQIDYDLSSGAGYNALVFRTGSDRLTNGDYYIAVSGGAVSGQPQTGAYSLSIRTQVNAQAFNESNLSLSLRVLGDIDLHRFHVNRPGRAFIYTTGNKDTELQLFDGNGTSLLTNDNSGHGYNASLSANLGVGDYYLKIQGGGAVTQAQTGFYRVCRQLPGNAEPILKSGSINRSIFPYGEIDCYVFTTTGGPVDFQTKGTTNTYGSLWGGDGVEIDNDESSGPGGINFRITRTLAAGRYYLAVRGSSIDIHKGSYTLVSSFPHANVTFPGVDSWLAGSLSHTFRFPVTSNTAWSVAEDLSWLKVSPSRGTGNKEVAVTVSTNNGLERSGLIKIGGVAVSVTQQAKSARSASDWNGDGSPDLVLQNTSSGRTAAWFVNEGTIRGTCQFPVLASDAGSRLVNHGDFNGDMAPDQVWQNPVNGNINIRYGNGMKYTSEGPLNPQCTSATSKVVAVGDFSLGGCREIVMQNTTSGVLTIWRVDANRQVVWTGTFSTQPGVQWRAVGAGDINGDGFSDLFLQHMETGQINVWLLNGVEVAASRALKNQPGSKDWRVCSLADHNADGRADIIMQDTVTGRLMLWLLNNYFETSGGEIPQKSLDPSWEVRNNRSW